MASSPPSPRIVALCPMKHESKRVPNKNHREFYDGKPIFHFVIAALQASKYITKILVDTDSAVITKYIQEMFPDVCVIARPEELLNDPPMTEILMYDTSVEPADFYFQTHATNPFLKTSSVDAAIEQFLSSGKVYDSVFSVNRWQTRLYDQTGRAINHNPNILIRTQDLPPVYEENSCMYVFSREVLAARHSRIGMRPLMFEMTDTTESVDIDTMEEWNLAQILAEKRFVASS